MWAEIISLPQSWGIVTFSSESTNRYVSTYSKAITELIRHKVGGRGAFHGIKRNVQRHRDIKMQRIWSRITQLYTKGEWRWQESKLGKQAETRFWRTSYEMLKSSNLIKQWENVYIFKAMGK